MEEIVVKTVMKRGAATEKTVGDADSTRYSRSDSYFICQQLALALEQLLFGTAVDPGRLSQHKSCAGMAEMGRQ